MACYQHRFFIVEMSPCPTFLFCGFVWKLCPKKLFCRESERLTTIRIARIQIKPIRNGTEIVLAYELLSRCLLCISPQINESVRQALVVHGHAVPADVIADGILVGM